jgi:Ca2+-binding EF-hand superfamily protein
VRNFVTKSRNTVSEGNLFKTSIIVSKNDKEKWIQNAIERLGFYITDIFVDLHVFFQKYFGEEYFTFEKFKLFLKEHPTCLDGLNLSEDEILILFSFLDPHKKGHITVNDLNEKLGNFDFYEKMHEEIKSYIVSFFKSPKEAYSFFNINSNNSKEASKLFLNSKEISDAIQNIFPEKYTSRQISCYLKLKFPHAERVEYSQFCFIYFDSIQTNEDFITKTRLKFSKSDTNFFKTVKMKNLTPFDSDPFEKMKRIIKSSRYNSQEFFKIYEVLNDGKLNVNEFINMIKKLNLGLSLLEINQIIAGCRTTKEGLIDMKLFMKNLEFEYDKLLPKGSQTLRNPPIMFLMSFPI